MLYAKKSKIGIIGCGSIGQEVALFIEKELKNHVKLTAIADKDLEKAQALAEKLSSSVSVCDPMTLIKTVDFVIEAASVEAARHLLKHGVALKKNMLILSVGALIKERQLLRQARARNVNVYIPSGAICGIDGLGALSLGEIKKISLTTSKPPKGLLGAAYLKKKKIDIEHIKHPVVVFKGNVLDAIENFPQNINVAATLFLAASFSAKGDAAFNEDDLEVCIKANPRINRNIHQIEIEAQEARITIAIENAPSKANPKTSALAIFSTQHLLKKIFSSVKIGS